MKYLLFLITITLSSYLFSQEISLYTDTLFLEKQDTFVLQQYQSNYNWIVDTDKNILIQKIGSNDIVNSVTCTFQNNMLFVTDKDKIHLKIIFYDKHHFKMYAPNTSFVGCYKINDN